MVIPYDVECIKTTSRRSLKHMDKETYTARREQWFGIIEACNGRESGVSKKQWCESNGITVRQLYYWERIFRQETSQGEDTMNPAAEISGKGEFVDITDLCGKDPLVLEKRPEFSPQVMIQVGAYQIYVNGSIRDETLNTVLKAVSYA